MSEGFPAAFAKRIAIICLLSAAVVSASANDYDDVELKARVLVQEMADTIHRGENRQLKDLLDTVIPKFNSGELPLYITDRIEESAESRLGNASFRYDAVDPSQPRYILLEKKLLRFYPERKSLTMAVILHEFAHAFSYYRYTDTFTGNTDNPLEKYLYEMDALYMEAQFIELCGAAGYELSRFENFLLGSLKDDHLAYASLLLLWYDNRLTWDMVRVKDAALNGEMSEKQALDDISAMGDGLVSRWHGLESSAENEWQRYVLFVQLRTWDQFVSKVLNPVLGHIDSDELDGEIARANALKEEMDAILESEWPFLVGFSDNFAGWLYSDLDSGG